MNKKILIIIVAVVLVVVVGAGAAVFILTRPPKEEPIVYYEFSLEEAYSNLADEDAQKIVKYKVTIEYTDEALLDVLTKNQTKISNNIDEILRSTNSADIEKPNGKQRLRDRIKDMIIEALESDEEVITNIYIQPFVIQG